MITVLAVDYDHMPDGAEYPVERGMTVRQALSALRKAGRENLGSIGNVHITLSDYSSISTPLQIDGGGRLLNSQQLTRISVDAGWETIDRHYAW